MFGTLQQKLLLGIYIFILLSIPVGAYLATQYTNIKSGAQEQKSQKELAKITPKPTTSPAKELLSSSIARLATGGGTLTSPAPAPETTVPTSYGPTLSLKVALEGRPSGNQATKLFVGIAEGTVTANPKFVLNFNVNIPASGEYANLSLAGLNPGSQYTALLKGTSQIATASAFTMSPNVSNLNNGQPVNLISGDLNDDNIINSADFSIAQKAAGATSTSANWNENVDLNKDGVINAFDLSIITKNIGQTGASGAWTSPLPQTASSSASLTPDNSGSPAIGGTTAQTDLPTGAGGPIGKGHWVWIPEF